MPMDSSTTGATGRRKCSTPSTIPFYLYESQIFSLLQSGSAPRLALRALAGVAVCQDGPLQDPLPHTCEAADHVASSHTAESGGFLGSVAIVPQKKNGEGPRSPFLVHAACQGAGIGAQSAIQGAESLAAARAATEAGQQLAHLASPNAQAHPLPNTQHHHPHHPHHHDPPPNSTLGFAEDASVNEEEENLKPAPRLTAASIIKSLIAGGVAGGVSRTAVAPLERLKILQQVQAAHGGQAQYTGMWQGLKRIWQQEGFNGLFKGNGVNCARIVPNSAVKFFAYEEASEGLLWLARQRTGDPDAELTPLLRLGAGATAGIIAMSATYPMDMVRGRLTVQGDGASRQYRNMFHAMATVWREEGPRALYRGWLPSVIGVVPYVGLNFAVYETLKDWLSKHYKSQERQRVESLGGAAGDAANVELSVVTKLACGAVAGTMGQTVAYPLDVVRRRLQMVGWKNAAPVLTAEGHLAVAPQYKGMVDAFTKTVQQEGVRALFRGLLPNSVKVVPSIAIAFVTYEMMKDLLGVEIRISD